MHIYIIRSFNAIVLQKNSWFSNIFSLGVNFVQNKNGYISYIYDDMTSKIKKGVLLKVKGAAHLFVFFHEYVFWVGNRDSSSNSITLASGTLKS